MATPFIPFNKLDKKRNFRFDMDAAFALEPHLPMGLYRAVRERFGPSMIVLCLWAGFRWEDKGLTVKKMRQIITKAVEKRRTTMAELQEFALEHVVNSDAFSGFAEAEPGDDEEEADDDEENPTGETSDGDGS